MNLYVATYGTCTYPTYTYGTVGPYYLPCSTTVGVPVVPYYRTVRTVHTSSKKVRYLTVVVKGDFTVQEASSGQLNCSQTCSRSG